MSDILTKVRKLNWLLQESPTGAFSFSEMCGILSELMDANVYIANTRGKVIGVNYKIKSDSSTIADPETGTEIFPGEYNEELMRIRETTANMSGEEALKIFKYDQIFSAVYGRGPRSGRIRSDDCRNGNTEKKIP